MRIALIGSGNIATVFGERFRAGGHTVAQVMSRNAAHAQALASTLDSAWTDQPEALVTDADAYVLAVSDSAVYEMAAWLRRPDALVVHTAGAVSVKALEPVSPRHGVLYPLQSIRKEVSIPLRIPILIDGADADTLLLVRSLGDAISDMVFPTDDAQRLRLHVGAVVVNNFPNYLYTLTEAWLRGQGVDFRYLQPLMEETVRRLAAYSPAEVMTGPAYRGDQKTVALHESMLEGELLEWYQLFTERIMAMYH